MCVVYPFIVCGQCMYIRVCYVACCSFLAALFPVMCLGSEFKGMASKKEVSLIEFEYVARNVCSFSTRG